METTNKIKTRFAPSPTGELHIGSARAALFPYLFARQNKGEFLVRIEDTDQNRLVKDSGLRMLELVKWLGLKWDEEPVYQSARTSLYKDYAHDLIQKGFAYPCFCSEKRLEELRAFQEKNHKPTGYDRKCRELSIEETLEKIKNNEPHVIRLKMPLEGKLIFQDLIHGKIEFDYSLIDDAVLLKADGFPTYHLAAIIDDHEQGITHVFRGDEWLSSVPKHLYLCQCFGWEAPAYAHMPVILGKDRKKLSKREDSVSVDAFKKEGYLPEAIINFIALLGWNPGTEQEFFSLSELEQDFDVEKINKSPAFFDIEKLNHFNAHYVHQTNDGELLEKIKPYSKIDYAKYKEEYLKRVAKVIKERMVLLTDFDDLASYFFEMKNYNKGILKFKKSEWGNTAKGLKNVIEVFEKIPEENLEKVESINEFLSMVVSENGLTNGDVFWSVRVALSGEEKSPSPGELIWVLGKEESLKRLNNALALIK